MFVKVENIIFTFPDGWSKLNQKTIHAFSENENGEFVKDYFSEILNVFISKNNNTIFLKKISNKKEIKSVGDIFINHIKNQSGIENFKSSFDTINDIDYLIIKFDKNLMTSMHYYFIYNNHTYVFDLRSLRNNFDHEVVDLKNIIFKTTFK